MFLRMFIAANCDMWYNFYNNNEGRVLYGFRVEAIR